MPRILLVVAVAAVGLLVFSPAYAQTQSAAEAEVIKAENDWMTAVQKKDGATLHMRLADECIETSSSGATSSKAQVIAEALSAADVIDTYLLTDLRVRVYGETGVVTGLLTIKSSLGGKDTSGAYRFTDTWVKRDGRWQCVAARSARVAKK